MGKTQNESPITIIAESVDQMIISLRAFYESYINSFGGFIDGRQFYNTRQSK